MKQVYIVIQGTVAAFIAWLSAKMGILLPVMGVLMGMMVMDYITGMLASKREALDHPDDPTYGWCSRRGAEGIIKKVGYLCVIAVAMVVDYLILRVVRVAIQNFLKNPVISMVFGHPNRKISCISPHIRATVLRQPPFFTPKI